MVTMIQTATLQWQQIDGIDIPVSTQFGDVYFSKDNGLLETRHVFLNGNDLTERLSKLDDYDYFCVGETGFGTGLNILALWQLWQQVRPNNHSHLHAISVEKFPLTRADLIRALSVWTELKPLADQIIEQYPSPIAGCHRLNFPKERFSLDLWLGDAHDVFPVIPKTFNVNAWFLDGFAPSCNPELWEENVLNHIVRLSAPSTTFASFSVAGVLKRGLKAHGIHITRPRGFGHKREMLKAIWQTENTYQPTSQKHIAVIGAGIAGLNIAWAFAQRGHRVSIFEKDQPLAGGSGNPLALLNPKLCPIEQAPEHLMTLSWQYALNHYTQFKAFRAIQVEQIGELQQLIADYPQLEQVTTSALETHHPRAQLKHAGAISPHQLKDEILEHPLIELYQQNINDLSELDHFDHIIVCTALANPTLIDDHPTLKPIRGQVSWCASKLLPLNQAFSYGGYCMQLDDEQLILGASFHPNRTDTDVTVEDHEHNLALLEKIYLNYQLPSINTWYGRASIRAQSLDYFPTVGKISDKVYSFAGLGSKGFLFAPLCSEILVADILKQACPAPQKLIEKLSPLRFKKKIKPKKPYYKKAP